MKVRRRKSDDACIDGMGVDEAWGWLLPKKLNKKDVDYYGCVKWDVDTGKLHLTWVCEE